MHRLTSHLLETYPFSRYASAQTIQRGRSYHKDERAWNVELVSDQKAVCLVDRDTGEYTVKNIIATEASFFKSLSQDDVKVLFQ